jgi:hypothetical protein
MWLSMGSDKAQRGNEKGNTCGKGPHVRDRKGARLMQIKEKYQVQVVCARCKTEVSFNEVSEGYFAVCPEHYEDLLQFETEIIIRDKGQG